MPLPDAAFRHHPNLKPLISDPEASYFRTFQPDEVKHRVLAEGGDASDIRSNAEREAVRREALSRRPDPDLWVFAYGSLMWDPAILFDEVRRAHAPGHARSFCLWDDGARGSEEAPGLMAALDRGTGCTGLAFHIPAGDVERETEIMCRREMIAPGYVAEYLPLETDQGPVTALAFVADHSYKGIKPGIPIAEQARMIATARGFLGTARAYLENIVSHLRELRIDDPYIADLWARVEAQGPGQGPDHGAG